MKSSLKNIVKVFLLSASLNLSTSAAATDDGVGGVCNAALGQGIRDNYHLLSEKQQFDSYQQRLCDAKYSSYDSFRTGATQLGLSIPIATGLLGISGGSSTQDKDFSEKYSKFCAASYFDKEYKEKFSSYVSQVSTVLADNWLRCHELHLDAWVKRNQYGVSISAIPQDTFSDFTVNVETRKVETGKVVIGNISPAGLVKCMRNGEEVAPGKTEVQQNQFQLDCTKSPLRDISVSIETNAGVSNSVKIPANTSKIIELEDRNKALQAQIVELRGEMKGQLTAITKEVDKNRYGIEHLSFTSVCTKDNLQWSATITRQSAPSCSPGWTDTGQFWNTDFPGGPAGMGVACRVCYMVKYP